MSSGYTVLANSVERAGNEREPPASIIVGATSCSCAVDEPSATPAQFLIQVVIVSAQAESLDSQQWWPPPTLVTMIESEGWAKSTTVCAAV